MRFNLHPLINQHPDLLPHLVVRRIWYLAGQPMAATCALIYTRLLINISGYAEGDRMLQQSSSECLGWVRL